jgi:hypothetical protein
MTTKNQLMPTEIEVATQLPDSGATCVGIATILLETCSKTEQICDGEERRVTISDSDDQRYAASCQVVAGLTGGWDVNVLQRSTNKAATPY